ncbi:MAG: flagellar basal body protein [Burkholderiaceae bacterium]|jgi:flagellar basal body rod protein FlgC|nr:flagellar basal body protein [Burkholderiaceae bacterium]MDP3134274.1 flagellar basal body protein [Burkholderiaceae bacterium]MDP3424091.1 flagellar basal body protein [Burkholderiaceae bacterium]MDZ4163315.1 flagellar basal body protein [Burkholderiales bacterium]
MSSLTSIAQTGLQAAQVRMGAAAHNVANAQTPDFRRQTVSAQAIATVSGTGASATGAQGVAVRTSQATQPGANLAQDMVDQLAARQAFVANLGVLKTSSDTLGSLLSVRA